MKGCYLVKCQKFNDPKDSFSTDVTGEIFVYASDNFLVEFRSNSDKEIEENKSYDADGNAIFNIDQRVDCDRAFYPGKANRLNDYTEVKFLFDNEPISSIFNIEKPDVDYIYMQCMIAQHCTWHQETSLEEMVNECMKVAMEFHANDNKYPYYDPNFKMPSPEEIELLKKKLGIIPSMQKVV